MTKKSEKPHGDWSHPGPRVAMLAEVRILSGTARSQRLAVRYDKPGHIDDEVVATLAIEAWKSGSANEANSYASVLLHRVAEHVRPHVRKNPGWARLGGGEKAVQDDFTQAVATAILQNSTKPCHAEVAFGNFVYRRCLDMAGTLYAKKHSAGESLDDDVEAENQESLDDSPAAPKSPEQLLIELEDEWEEQGKLEQIRLIVQGDLLPERARNAFTYRFYGPMKIESKKAGEVTVTSLMGITEKTATKYINEAIEIIQQRLKQ